MTTVGSQDTTGPMTRDELKDLACLGFSADLVMQSFCHTAAYPKPVDVADPPHAARLHHARAAASRCVPATASSTPGSTACCCPTPSAPAATRTPASRSASRSPPAPASSPSRPRPASCRSTCRNRCWCASRARCSRGITLRDLVNAIPYAAIKQGLLTVEKKGKKNVFNGRILEIEGLPDLKVEQAFELSDASAERSAAGCTVRLEQGADHRVPELERHAAEVDDRRGLRRRRARWSAASRPWRPGSRTRRCCKADADAEYAAVIEIDLADDQGAAARLPERSGRRQAAVGGRRRQDRRSVHRLVHDQHRPLPRRRPSCCEGKTDIPTRLWIAPPTKMDASILKEEGYYAISAEPARAWKCRAARCAWATRREIRRAARRVDLDAQLPRTVSASTRASTWPRRSLAAVGALLGKIPTFAEYMAALEGVKGKEGEVYRYMNFDQIEGFKGSGRRAATVLTHQQAGTHAHRAVPASSGPAIRAAVLLPATLILFVVLKRTAQPYPRLATGRMA